MFLSRLKSLAFFVRELCDEVEIHRAVGDFEYKVSTCTTAFRKVGLCISSRTPDQGIKISGVSTTGRAIEVKRKGE